MLRPGPQNIPMVQNNHTLAWQNLCLPNAGQAFSFLPCLLRHVELYLYGEIEFTCGFLPLWQLLNVILSLSDSIAQESKLASNTDVSISHTIYSMYHKY